MTQDLAGTANDLTVTLGYNPAGQIVSRTGSNVTYAYTAANQDLVETPNGLNQVTQQGVDTIGYDSRGNLNYNGGKSYIYASENLLTSASGSVALGYDPVNRLAWTTGNPDFTRFAYDGGQIIAEYDYSFGLTARYAPGPSTDETLVWYNSSGIANRRWLHTDERGSVIAVSDDQGNAIGINKYDEYGQPQGALTGRFGYTGQAWLPEIGLAYYKARMYHPGIGRFMQTDPIGYSAGQNLHGYVIGDPINSVDSTGTCNATDGKGTGTNTCVQLTTGSLTGGECSSCNVTWSPGNMADWTSSSDKQRNPGEGGGVSGGSPSGGRDAPPDLSGGGATIWVTADYRTPGETPTAQLQTVGSGTEIRTRTPSFTYKRNPYYFVNTVNVGGGIVRRAPTVDVTGYSKILLASMFDISDAFSPGPGIFGGLFVGYYVDFLATRGGDRVGGGAVGQINVGTPSYRMFDIPQGANYVRFIPTEATGGVTVSIYGH